MSLLRPLAQSLRLARSGPTSRPVANLSTSVIRRGGGWSYREPPKSEMETTSKIAMAMMTVTWWWIFHGILTEPAHIFPFWDNYPDPAQWTDKQLGIPADDE